MIPFIDLQSQYKAVQADLEQAVLEVLRSGQYIQGPDVEKLEARLCEYAGTRYAVSCASGTDALVIALMAKGVGPGDAVFAPPFTFVATAEAIALVGAVPIFVDVEPHSFNLDPEQLERAIRAVKGADPTVHPLPALPGDQLSKLTAKAVIAVDLFGLPADYARINAIAEAEGLFVIEDAAQSFGGQAQNKRAGALAEIACTSFFPAKPLGCYGDGGALFTDDAELADLFRSIRVHGQGEDRYENVRIGITGRLDTLQATILLQKLAIFDGELAKRQQVAELYTDLIDRSGLELVTPEIPQGYRSAWAQYTLMASDRAARDAVRAKLAASNVPSTIYYPKPLHLQTAFAHLGYGLGDFEVSEECADRVFSLPMHPYLEPETVRFIVGALSG